MMQRRASADCAHFFIPQQVDAVIAIDDGTVLEGDMPRNEMKLVQAWLEIHREDLVADWNLAVQGLPPQRIKPLE